MRTITGVLSICVGICFVSRCVGDGSEVKWKEDVSHEAIPNQPAAGMIGTKNFVVKHAQVRKAQSSGKPREYESFTLELTSSGGTPGVEITIAVPHGGKLDGKTIWRKNMMSTSEEFFVGKGAKRVGYPPFQGVWLRGERDKNFSQMEVFKKTAVMEYSAQIKFGTSHNGKLPGSIYMCGKADTFFKSPKWVLAGKFNAAVLVGKND